MVDDIYREEDLNQISIKRVPWQSNLPAVPPPDFNQCGADFGFVTRDHLNVFKSVMREYPVILGSVAWITHDAFFQFFKSRECAFVVDKSTDWYPALARLPTFADTLRARFGLVENDFDRRDFWNTHLEKMVVLDESGQARADEWGMEGVRCLGYYDGGEKLFVNHASPQNHPKVCIGCVSRACGPGRVILPRAVWCGSLNFTRTGELSINDCFYMKGDEYSKSIWAAHKHVCWILSLSEPLGWYEDDRSIPSRPRAFWFYEEGLKR